MSRLTKAQVVKTLASRGTRFMILTYGQGYSLDDGRAIDRRIGEQLTGDLFCDLPPMPCKGQARIVPNNDGLFPGFSQTFRIA